MKPEDFGEFADQRVRDVMAAAANLLEHLETIGGFFRFSERESKQLALKAALFAAQHTKPKPGPCTCHLERQFGAAQPLISDGAWEVIDAECEKVAETNEEAYAELVAAALNAYGRKNTCIAHRDNPHYPHAPDYECDVCPTWSGKLAKPA